MFLGIAYISEVFLVEREGMVLELGLFSLFFDFFRIFGESLIVVDFSMEISICLIWRF